MNCPTNTNTPKKAKAIINNSINKRDESVNGNIIMHILHIMLIKGKYDTPSLVT
jgi:hypothetical protein